MNRHQQHKWEELGSLQSQAMGTNKDYGKCSSRMNGDPMETQQTL